MGWQANEFGIAHEGYAVAVLGDGSEPPPVQLPLTTDPGATAPNSAWWLYDGSTPAQPRAVAVRAACACGWRSNDMFPVDFQDHEETEGYEYGEGPAAAWEREHIAQLLGTTIPDDVADAITQLRRMLTGLAETRPLAAIAASTQVERMGSTNAQIAVTTARSRPGGSWEAIGAALGVSRQAAHQRFSKVPFTGGGAR